SIRRHTRWPLDCSSDVCSSDLHRGSVAERAIAEGGSVVAIFDRPWFPLATASVPRELSRLYAHVHVADDLAAAGIRCVVNIPEDDGTRRLAGRIAVVVEAGVGHPDHLTRPIEADGPVPIVARRIGLDHPVRLCVPVMDRQDRINEIDDGQSGEGTHQAGRYPRADPVEVSASEGAEDAGS